MNNYIDLHMHSICSDDGQYSPEELVSMCCRTGVSIMAIADHNCVRSIDREMKACTQENIRGIPAVEIDCTFQNTGLHVLGYGIQWHMPVFQQIEDSVRNQEIACGQKKLELTNALGFHVHKEQMDSLSSDGVYTGEMFAEVLLKDPDYQDHPLLKPYRKNGLRSDNPYVNFYWDYYSQGKPCYTEVHYPSLQQTLQIIRDANGVSVLAHPGISLKGKPELFQKIADAGIQGVEAFSSYHSDSDREFYLKQGQERNLLITCGSDFHGKTKPSIHLGETGCTIDEKQIETQLIHLHLI